MPREKPCPSKVRRKVCYNRCLPKCKDRKTSTGLIIPYSRNLSTKKCEVDESRMTAKHHERWLELQDKKSRRRAIPPKISKPSSPAKNKKRVTWPENVESSVRYIPPVRKKGFEGARYPWKKKASE